MQYQRSCDRVVTTQMSYAYVLIATVAPEIQFIREYQLIKIPRNEESRNK